MRPLNIAVLDDEPFIRDLLQDSLRDQGHYVACFENAQAALAALCKQRFDVILSDIKMPGMNGLDFYGRVLERCPHQAQRILFLSGDLMAAQTRDFVERTGCLTLTKPFRQATLLAKINELVQRGEVEQVNRKVQYALPKAA